jgi:5,10-methylenetetrahydrofolate reductase
MEITEIAKRKGKGKKVVTSELGPPKGTDLGEFFRQAEFLKGRVDAVNVTDQQAAIMKLGSLASCIKLKEKGFEPILQITVRDKNRIALQSELLSAAVFGIENVLVLTGDPVQIGDHPDAKPVFDLDAVALMGAMKKLESGEDLAGKKLAGAPRFCIAAAANPCVKDLDTEFSKLRAKIQGGADFFQTQGVFDARLYETFHARLSKENIGHPFLAGIILLKSAKMARFMNEKIPGIVIPPELIERLEKAGDPKEECVRIAVETIDALRDKVAGFHLMAIGWEELIPEIVRRARL